MRELEMHTTENISTITTIPTSTESVGRSPASGSKPSGQVGWLPILSRASTSYTGPERYEFRDAFGAASGSGAVSRACEAGHRHFPAGQAIESYPPSTPRPGLGGGYALYCSGWELGDNSSQNFSCVGQHGSL